MNVNSSGQCTFSYSVTGVDFIELGNVFGAKAGKGGGARVGLFCINPNNEISKGYVDLDWFVVEER